MNSGVWFARRTAKSFLSLMAIAAAASGIAVAQLSFSLSSDLSNKTLILGKNMSGDVMLGLELYEGQPVAVAGVTGSAGDKFSFDSQGTLSNGAGFWKAMSSQYVIRLNQAKEPLKQTADPTAAGDRTIWIGQDSGGKNVQTSSDGNEIAPFILQQTDVASKLQGAFAVLLVGGNVRWNANGRLSDGKDGLLGIRFAGAELSKVIESKVDDNGTLVVSIANGSKYKISALSSDFTATIEELKAAPQ